MDRSTFLNELAAGLALLKQADRKQILDYYDEMILDGIESGLPEAEAVAGLEPPEQIAARIRVEYGARQQTPPEGPEGLEYQPRSIPEKLELRTWEIPVRLARTADPLPRILIEGCQADWVTVDEQEGQFRLTLRLPMPLFSGHVLMRSFFLGSRHPAVTLELPEGFGGKVLVQTRNERVEAAGLRLEGKLDLGTSCAPIDLEDCHVARLRAGTSNSRITLQGLVGSSCHAATSNSRITAEDCHFSQTLNLSSSNAALKVAGIRAPEIRLGTSNAAIKGWIRGSEAETAVTCRTSNARCNLANTGAEIRPNRLRAATSNAKIDLVFLPEGPSEE